MTFAGEETRVLGFFNSICSLLMRLRIPTRRSPVQVVPWMIAYLKIWLHSPRLFQLPDLSEHERISRILAPTAWPCRRSNAVGRGLWIIKKLLDNAPTCISTLSGPPVGTVRHQVLPCVRILVKDESPFTDDNAVGGMKWCNSTYGSRAV